jgi:two-component system, NarL family, nitrate/nitrite response regulator NarL
MTDPIRILLVDDQPAVRQGLRLHLSCEANLSIVGEASDGQQAVTLAEELAPDVVVLDISMPGMDGFETARRIRDAGSAAIVMLSLRDDAASRARAMDVGADAFVSKNEATSELVQAIQRVSTRTAAAPAHIDPGQISTGGA